jgi:signal transduction histidine kinase
MNNRAHDDDEPPDATEARPYPGAELALELPRLELDQLLGQLIERAQEVMATQGRLRGLLRATRSITADLTLPVVLRRIVEAARELIGADYSALGVIAPDGHLSQFVHTGMSEDAVAAIGHLPQGKGLLGALITNPAPIRLRRLGADSRSSGFPPGHPPMEDFLGVPIRVRDEVFGNLYLTGKRGPDGFTAEDEELAVALAAAAGAAIDNARLYETARSRGDWLRASATITRTLLAPPAPDEPSIDPLRLIAEAARDIAQADLVTVTLPPDTAADHGEDGADRWLRVHLAVGAGGPPLTGLRVPMTGTLAGKVFTRSEPVRVASPAERPDAVVASIGELEMGPVLAMPLLGSHRTHGVLTMARAAGQRDFSADDLEMASSFANQASIALELAEARLEQQRAEMVADRDRIAGELHDNVIQQLFGTGLALQGLAGAMQPGREQAQLLGAVAELDRTIAQLRASIFQLHHVERGGAGVRQRLLDAVSQAAIAMGFEPAVQLSGLLEGTLAEPLVEDLLAVLAEALSNVARHARARWATVEVDHTAGRLVVRVEDDGVGIGTACPRGGLRKLRLRAERRGGDLELLPRQPTGTSFCWSVPTT